MARLGGAGRGEARAVPKRDDAQVKARPYQAEEEDRKWKRKRALKD